ncbi:hypothetical protein FDP41_006011 [Naegleria fowleri]|uniref:Uncharacterized protein n=1 Tax=Naegleria fowleri TaxID=5763 RepID=A0A6A5BQL5_NAEFO|nr:uncharacterized protein FDP41_006011 [Naegleria fowleri]KAF0975259.1 hypothetical protein FDP41_006011 [Naegleria fowleri]
MKPFIEKHRKQLEQDWKEKEMDERKGRSRYYSDLFTLILGVAVIGIGVVLFNGFTKPSEDEEQVKAITANYDDTVYDPQRPFVQ